MRADSLSEPKLPPVPAMAGGLLVIRKPSRHFGSGFSSTAVGFVLFGLALFLQWLGGAYHNEFAGYPDEGAHFVTGLMLRDIVAQRQLTSLQQFAENYYLHYPKVALGHWPPFF